MEPIDTKKLSEIELYKIYLTMATYRCGGEVIVTVAEFDEMRKVVCGVSCGVVGDKFLIRNIVNPEFK